MELWRLIGSLLFYLLLAATQLTHIFCLIISSNAYIVAMFFFFFFFESYKDTQIQSYTLYKKSRLLCDIFLYICYAYIDIPLSKYIPNTGRHEIYFYIYTYIYQPLLLNILFNILLYRPIFLFCFSLLFLGRVNTFRLFLSILYIL